MIFPVLILISLIIFSFSIALFVRVYYLTKDLELKPVWIVLTIFIVFFALGYFCFGFDLVAKEPIIPLNLLVTGIFLVGSIFVLVASYLFFTIIKTLDRRVADRTRKLELQHKKNIEKEKQIQALKDQFIFIAAHELSTPVNAIRWSLELLDETENLKKKCTIEELNLLANIQSSNDFLVSLVQDLLNTSRMEYGTFKINKEKFYLEKIIEQAITELKYLATEKNVTINWKKQKTTPPQVYADQQRTKEIFINLLSNAIKYNLPDGKVDISIKPNKQKITVTIKDNGIGLDKQDIQKLFQKFARLDNPQTRDIKGTGLGLYITKQIVEKMNGEISVKSAGRNQGSTFTFTLPIDNSPKK
jgi:signal transduction histidine kinase